MRATTIRIATISLIALAVTGCGSTTDADSLNDDTPPPGGGSGGSTAGPSGGSGPAPSSGGSSTGIAGSSPSSGGSSPASAGAPPAGGSGNVGVGGASGGGPSAGSGPVGTAGSGEPPMGGSGGGPAGGAPGTGGTTPGAAGTAGAPPMGGSGGAAPTGPYAPRTGSFKMLAYSATKGYRHEDAIASGKTMLGEIAKEQGFELTLTEANTDITPEGLAKYEVIFFMNPTGDIFNDAQQKAFEDWMTQKNGAFAGTHSATDTEINWAFYKEVTGQYYDLHDPCCAMASVQWDEGAANFIAVKGLPSPWQRSEEWYKFNSAASWTGKAGFKVLSRVTTSGGGTRPVSYIREYSNFRAFYTSIGHEGVAFRDANVKKHVAAGIMWAARREALLK